MYANCPLNKWTPAKNLIFEFYHLGVFINKDDWTNQTNRLCGQKRKSSSDEESDKQFPTNNYSLNKLASLEATLVRNYDPPTYPLTYWQG